jgi:hypothetical protein
MIKTTKNY